MEDAILTAMEDWLKDYSIQIKSQNRPKVDPVKTALDAVRSQLAQLRKQQETICEYLEKRVCTVDMFTKRNAVLEKEINSLQGSEAELMRQQESSSKERQTAREVIPTVQHILDRYGTLTAEEKNRLWKLVLKKATAYRTPEGELSVNIYPTLPK